MQTVVAVAVLGIAIVIFTQAQANKSATSQRAEVAAAAADSRLAMTEFLRRVGRNLLVRGDCSAGKAGTSKAIESQTLAGYRFRLLDGSFQGKPHPSHAKDLADCGLKAGPSGAIRFCMELVPGSGPRASVAGWFDSDYLIVKTTMQLVHLQTGALAACGQAPALSASGLRIAFLALWGKARPGGDIFPGRWLDLRQYAN